jgi:hypothetical protein
LINPKRVTRKVCFDFSAKYELGGEDQYDTNKLFGISFGSVHENSARFGWRFDKDRSRFVLSAYCYIDRQRIMADVADCFAGRTYECLIQVTREHYLFTVIKDSGNESGTIAIKKFHNKKIGWLLGCFFGGNQSAPNNMRVEITKT